MFKINTTPKKDKISIAQPQKDLLPYGRDFAFLEISSQSLLLKLIFVTNFSCHKLFVTIFHKFFLFAIIFGCQ